MPHSYVESLETRLEQSEALVRQLRGELAEVHFNKSSSSVQSKESVSSGSPPDSTPGLEPMNPKGYNASLYILQTALRSLSAPPPPPHADDLVHLEITRKVCLGYQTLIFCRAPCLFMTDTLP